MVKKKGPYTPFPPPQQPSKIDLQLESGEFFLNQHTKRKKEAAAKRDGQAQRTAARHRDRAASFVAPQVLPPPSVLSGEPVNTVKAATYVVRVTAYKLSEDLTNEASQTRHSAGHLGEVAPAPLRSCNTYRTLAHRAGSKSFTKRRFAGFPCSHPLAILLCRSCRRHPRVGGAPSWTPLQPTLQPWRRASSTRAPPPLQPLCASLAAPSISPIVIAVP